MRRRPRPRQAGAVLLIALVLLGVLTVATAAAVRFSVFGLRIAVGEELRLSALQSAQSLVDAVLAVPSNLAVTGAVGDTACAAGIAGCSRNTLVVRDEQARVIFGRAEARGSAIVRRLGPAAATPPRNVGYSAVKFQAAFLRVEGAYDAGGGWGRAELREGVTAVIPAYGN